MRSQFSKEMLEIVVPFGIAIIAFTVLLGGIFSTTVSVSQTFIPYKVASMVAHSLTGSTQCLALGTELPHKGLLDLNKIESFADSYSDSHPPCVEMPCWTFRAKIEDLETGTEYRFGYKSSDTEENDNYWDGEPESYDDALDYWEIKGIDLILLQTPDIGGTYANWNKKVDVRTMTLPVAIDSDGTRTLGKLTIDVRPRNIITCQGEIAGITAEVA
jgi:hypothetical protein